MTLAEGWTYTSAHHDAKSSTGEHHHSRTWDFDGRDSHAKPASQRGRSSRLKRLARGRSMASVLDALGSSLDAAGSSQDGFLLLTLHRSESLLESRVAELGRQHGVSAEFATRVTRLLADLVPPGIREPRITFDDSEGEFHIQWFDRARHVEISIPESDEVYVSIRGFGNLSFAGFFAAFPTMAVRRVLPTLASN